MNKMKKDIVHPIFLKLASLQEDTFWKYIYEDLSYGKCPYGIYIQNDYICCFIKGKEFSYYFEDKEECLQEIHTLLKNKAGILSEKEKIQQKEDFFQKKNNEKKFINKKFLRENLIQNFVIKQGKLYNIGSEHKKNLISFLYNAFLFKVVQINDINFTEGEIDSVNGIEFKPQEIIIQKKLFQNSYILNTIDEEKKINIFQLWTNYINDIKHNFI